MPVLPLLARSTFSTIFVIAGFKALSEPGRRPELVQKALPVPEQHSTLLVRVNGGLMLGFGTGLALGVQARACALALAATMVPTTYVGHQFWAAEAGQPQQQQQIHFMKNVSLIGGLLSYALTEDR